MSKARKVTDKGKRGQLIRRHYTDRTLKLLWGRAAGRCAVPNCRVQIYADETAYDPVVPIGDIAHIAAASNDGPRATASMSLAERNSYENLILLCASCHRRLDGQKNTNTVEIIRQLKKNHEDWVRASLPERGRSKVGWTTILLRDHYPIDALTMDAALTPDYVSGSLVEIDAATDSSGWKQLAHRVAGQVKRLEPAGDTFDTRFAVFPLAAVTACLALGYIMTNRPTVQLFQFFRDKKTWAWPDLVSPPDDLRLQIAKPALSAGQVVFVFEISARVRSAALRSLRARPALLLGSPNPSTRWLQHRDQLATIGIRAREMFEVALDRFPRANLWHIFYAGPAPGAVAVGQQLNPTMSPPAQLYEYSGGVHKPSLVLNADLLETTS